MCLSCFEIKTHREKAVHCSLTTVHCYRISRARSMARITALALLIDS